MSRRLVVLAIVIGLGLIIAGGAVALVAGAAAYFVACGHLTSLSTLIDLAFWLQLTALGGTIAVAGIVQLVT
jgi:hypothetical protein